MRWQRDLVGKTRCWAVLKVLVEIRLDWKMRVKWILLCSCTFFLYVYFRETCCFRLELLFMLRVQVASQKGETCTPSVGESSRWSGTRFFYYCECNWQVSHFFFPGLGEHSVNQGWLCATEDVCQMSRLRPLFHHSTMSLVQVCSPPR
jgi:hypothetical protein